MEARVSCGVIVAAQVSMMPLARGGWSTSIEAFVAQPSIERLDEGVLHR
jgi:hypothetical protein